MGRLRDNVAAHLTQRNAKFVPIENIMGRSPIRGYAVFPAQTDSFYVQEVFNSALGRTILRAPLNKTDLVRLCAAMLEPAFGLLSAHSRTSWEAEQRAKGIET